MSCEDIAALAQMEELLPCKQGVASSSLAGGSSYVTAAECDDYLSCSLTANERALHYRSVFPKFEASWPSVSGRWLSASWMLGNSYRGSGYYGAFPPALLKRIAALFPDMRGYNTLQLFSGSLKKGDYVRVDSNPINTPEVVCDAHYLSDALSESMPGWRPSLIIADPPYSAADAVYYGTKMVNRRKILHQCHKVIRPFGHLAWLDTQLPMYRKDMWRHYGNIAIIRSTNHRVRLLSLFEAVNVGAVTYGK